ncbi:uncharacterized protein LOC135847520 [Planococcus citri]|uniref:uncharacterized protein LOC135847520 n=1 Tax=Planococcus citri TaxID=170843 RepID=UPI0031F97BBC
MIWFKITPLIVIEVLLIFNVQTSPFSSDEKPNKISKRDVESVVSSSPIKLIPPEKIEKLRKIASMENSPIKFRWSADNSSFMQDLEDMFSSIEREIDEMLNHTKTKLSEGGMDFNDEFFSFSFFDSDSDSKSEEQTAAPEAEAE